MYCIAVICWDNSEMEGHVHFSSPPTKRVSFWVESAKYVIFDIHLKIRRLFITSLVCVDVTCICKLPQFHLTFIWLGIEFGSEVHSRSCLWKIPHLLYIYKYISAPALCPLSILQWLMVGPQGSHQAELKEFQKLRPPSHPRLQSLTSFYSLVLPLVSVCPVFCPLALSPSICERDTWQRVCPPSACLLHVSALSPFPPPSRGPRTCASVCPQSR